MKQLLFFIAVIFVITSCNEQETKEVKLEAIRTDSSKFTTIAWSDTAVDFGTKKMGDLVDITFTCTNTGDKPLYLVYVRPSCGCTVADYTKEPIAPGKKGKIAAQFDTKKAHPGDVHKTIFVTTNTSNHTPPVLKFSGKILPADSAVTVKN